MIAINGNELTKDTKAADAVSKQTAYFYDYAVRRVGGRLLANVDFSINKERFAVDEFELKYVVIKGDFESYEIVKWEDEGLPPPPSTGSPYVLKIVIPPGGTVYVLFPLPSEPAVPYAAYVTAYAKDYEVYVEQYIAIDTDETNRRNYWPGEWKQLPNQWARVCNTWALEINWALTSMCYKIRNPQSVSVTVYIAGCLASQISGLLKGWSILWGYIQGYELDISGSVTATIRLFLPANIADVYLLQSDGKIAGDGTNALSITAYLNNKQLYTYSRTLTTPYTFVHRFKISNVFQGTPTYETVQFKVYLSTAGTGKLSRLTVILFGATREARYVEYKKVTVAAGSTTMLWDYTSNCDGHIIEIHELEVTTDSAATATIEVHDGDGWKPLADDVPPGSTLKITNLEARLLGIRVTSTGGDTTVKARVIKTDSFLIW